MNSLRQALKHRLAKALFACRVALPGKALRSSYGPWLIKRPGDATYRFCVRGVYGHLLSSFLQQRDEPFEFWDIGANIGLYSLLAAQNRSCSKVIAFEPIPATFRFLAENIWFNRCTNVFPICGAVSNSASPILTFSFDPKHTGAAHSSKRGMIVAPVIGRSALEALSPADTKIVVKIDVEGGEISVVQVLRESGIYRRVSSIFVEVSHDSLGIEGAQELLSMLSADGFQEVARTGIASYYDAHFQRS